MTAKLQRRNFPVYFEIQASANTSASLQLVVQTQYSMAVGRVIAGQRVTGWPMQRQDSA